MASCSGVLRFSVIFTNISVSCQIGIHKNLYRCHLALSSKGKESVWVSVTDEIQECMWDAVSFIPTVIMIGRQVLVPSIYLLYI